MNDDSLAHFPMKAMPLLVVSSIALALAGCASSSTAPKAGSDTAQASSAASQPDSLGATDPAPTARKPCEYMARGDAEAAVGQSLPTTTERISLGTCDHTTPDFFGASLTVGDWESIKAAATSDAQHQPIAIAGVGDEALSLNGAGGSNLYVRKGNRGFLLVLNGPNVDGLPDHGLDREKILALKILPNF